MNEYKFNNTCSSCTNHECPQPPKLTSYTSKELRQALKSVIVQERKEFERIRKRSLLKMRGPYLRCSTCNQRVTAEMDDKRHCELIEAIERSRAGLRTKLERAEKALEFYAHKKNYFSGVVGKEVVGKTQGYGDERIWQHDNGDIARAWLEKWGKG